METFRRKLGIKFSLERYVYACGMTIYKFVFSAEGAQD